MNNSSKHINMRQNNVRRKSAIRSPWPRPGLQIEQSLSQTSRPWPRPWITGLAAHNKPRRKGGQGRPQSTMLCVVSFLTILTIAIPLWPESVWARKDIVKRDTDKDGKIDQIVQFDKRGKIMKLEIDSNGDEIMDRFQHYECEEIIRVERDTNYDQKINAWDYFEAGKRIRHECASTETGRVDKIIVFDSEERPLKMQKDTTADGLFDSTYQFEKGKLSSCTKDTDSDGKANVWQTFKDDRPVERRTDDDGDGQVERMTFFDSEGLPKESRHDLNRDGKMEVVRFYSHG